jgi:transmembrane sensor
VVAASVVLTFAFGIGWYFWPAGPAYETSVGGVEAVALSDGSNVTLNTNSEIRVALTDTERHIELMRGEAFFDVAKDPARPFVVLAGGQRVVAVGTKFSVRRAERRADEVRVVVTEGRVRVGPVAGVAPELPPAEVAAGSIARAGGAGVLIEEQPARPVDEYLSWRSGYLVFRATALADAVAEFNRYNTTKLVIEDPAVAAIEIGGNFRSTNVDAFVRLLKDGFSIRVEQRGDEIVLTAARQ